MIIKLKEKTVEFTQSDEQKKKKRMLESEGNLRDIRTIISCNTIYIIEFLERKRKGVGELFKEMMAEKFPNLRKETDIHF